jgi:small subunit ribosomal protein S4
MSKRIAAKHKIDRRLSENIWGRPKSPLNKRESRPGQHGERRVSKQSDYGQQLKAKQKLKGYYGSITERQFRKVYQEAVRMKGSTSEQLIGLLERRLASVVYRAKFVPTVFAARQFVSHGHVSVNGRRVTIPSYRVRVGDVIEMREAARQNVMVLEAVKSSERDIPDYLDVDHGKMVVKMSRVPALADVPYPVTMEPNLVVEFYSR